MIGGALGAAEIGGTGMSLHEASGAESAESGGGAVTRRTSRPGGTPPPHLPAKNNRPTIDLYVPEDGT